MTTWQTVITLVVAINSLLIVGTHWGLKVLADAIIELFDQKDRP